MAAPNGRSNATPSLNARPNCARRSNRRRHQPKESERDGVAAGGAGQGAVRKLRRACRNHKRNKRNKRHASPVLHALHALRKHTRMAERPARRVMVRSGGDASAVVAAAVTVAGRKAGRRQRRRSDFSPTILDRASD